MFWHMQIIIKGVLLFVFSLSVCIALIYPYGKHLASLPDGPRTKAGMKTNAELAE